MQHKSDWDLDLKFGQLHEGLVRALMCGEVSLEVKTDRRAHETGNVAVELSSRHKPSGLVVTKAEYWAFVLPGLDNSVVLVRTERLKALALRSDVPLVRGGDENTSVLALLPLSDLIKV